MVNIDCTKTISVMSYKNEPVAFVNPGEMLSVKTMDCFSNRIVSENTTLKDIPWNEVNPATGPIYVNGAETGDVLQVTIVDIITKNRSVVLSESEDLTRYDYPGNAKSLFSDVFNGKIIISNELSVDLSPMIGVIGTAPEKENIPTTLPGVHGGNMDNTHIATGSVVFLPVFHKGALLSLGDLHAAMGNGESTGSGLEIAGEVKMQIDIIKSCKMPLPMVKTKTLIETVASASTLDEASVLAVRNMLKYLTENLGFETESAWKLLAACGDVGICQFANAIKTTRCSLPIQYLERKE